MTGFQFLHYLPTLPYVQTRLFGEMSADRSRKRKDSLNSYLLDLSRIAQSTLFTKFDPWIRWLTEFFDLNNIRLREKEAALIIEERFIEYRHYLKRRKYYAWLAKKRGYIINLNDLPNHLLLLWFSFLSMEELYISKSVCKSWKFLTKDPTLWVTLSLFPDKINIEETVLSRLIS